MYCRAFALPVRWSYYQGAFTFILRFEVIRDEQLVAFLAACLDDMPDFVEGVEPLLRTPRLFFDHAHALSAGIVCGHGRGSADASIHSVP